MAVVLRALTLLGLTGASCALFVQELIGDDWLFAFVSGNTMTLANRHPLLAVAGAIAYGIYFSVFTLRMHGRFQTYNFDLGQYDNLFWNLMHGYPLRMSPLGLDANWTDLRNHADLSVFFFIPFYAIKPG